MAINRLKKVKQQTNFTIKEKRKFVSKLNPNNLEEMTKVNINKDPKAKKLKPKNN
jgi:hypothetical protein